MSNTRVRMHPTLGILVCTDGHVMIPANGKNPGHWTLGCTNSYGYRQVGINGKIYRVHRLVAETFIPNPENLPTVDHINRDRSVNMVEGLRWADRKMQNDNTIKVDRSVSKYGVRACDDTNAYWRVYRRKRYATDPEFAEHVRARSRESMRKYRASLKNKKEV